MMNNIAILLGMGTGDAEYINSLINDMWELSDDNLLDDDTIGMILQNSKDGYDLTNNLIQELIYATMDELLNKMTNYAINENLEDDIEFLEDIELDMFINCIDSHGYYMLPNGVAIPYTDVLGMSEDKAIEYLRGFEN